MDKLKRTFFMVMQSWIVQVILFLSLTFVMLFAPIACGLLAGMDIEASEQLNYYGQCAGALGTIFLGMITIRNSKKYERENVSIQKKLIELTEQANALTKISSESCYPYLDLQCVSSNVLSPKQIDRIFSHDKRGIVYSLPYKQSIEDILNCTRKREVEFRSKDNNSGFPKDGQYFLTLNFGDADKRPSDGIVTHCSIISLSDARIVLIRLCEINYSTSTKEDKLRIPFDIDINGIVLHKDKIDFDLEILGLQQYIGDDLITLHLKFEVATISEQKFEQKIDITVYGTKIISKVVMPPTMLF